MHADQFVRMFGLAGRVALVTGARHGIGRALALTLARAGAHVAVTGRDRSALAPLVTELEAVGGDHVALALDVRDEAQIPCVVEAAAARWGRLDIVVNNAGLSIRRRAIDYEAAEWDAVVATNLRGPFLLCQAAARLMSARGGRIVNVSSTFARAAVPERAPYAASKAALEHLTRCLAVEWAASGITVNGIAPGATLTETRRTSLGDEDAMRRQLLQIPLGRLGVVDDLAGSLLLLSSDAGRFITGQTIVVDGGYTLRAGG